MVYILAAILVFGVLIAVHELGHFMAAKACGVRVNEFSIGMGPALWKKQKGETQYSLRLFPVGGFCAMEGEEEDSDDPTALNNQGFWAKLLIFAAGAAMNFIAGLLIILVLYADAQAFYVPVVAGFADGCPLESADGLQEGDRLLRIDGEKVYVYSDISLLMGLNKTGAFDLQIKRNGEVITLRDFTMERREYTDQNGKAYTGYGLYFGAEEATLGRKLSYSWNNAMDFARLVRLSLQMLVTGQAGVKDLSGPVGIVSTMTQVGEQAATTRAAVENIAYLAALIAVTIGLLFIGSIFFLSSFFIKSILVPVSQINATAKRIAAGSYGVQIPGQYDDEIGELVSTINDMSVKIGQAEKTQTEFISSVSHELRTPLTAISGWGETLLTSENLDAETRRGVVIIAREAKRLTGMVEELLEFTRMQDGRFTLHVETADILAEFEDTVFMYGNRLKQEGICLHYDGCDEEIPEIPCDVARMRQVFLNILDNAAKHGGEGKRIDASIAHEGSFVVIRMRDYGPGIPEEELPHVKLKFYKGSSKARGSGIGLAVCEEIVTMHGGTLTLENAEGGGTLVTISIPTGEE